MPELDAEEKEVLESYERDEWQPISGLAKELERYRQYALETFKKYARANIRITKKELESIQKRALEEGIPYQTLMPSVLHMYLNGRLIEKRNN